jgi:hypothetical protein
LVVIISASACSLRPIAVRSTADVIEGGVGALYDEADPVLAKDAFPAQLKLLEELLYNSPRNSSLLVLAAQGFAGYSFLFVEDSNPARAAAFYQRGRNYALRALANQKKFKNIKTESLDALSKELKTTSRKDAAPLFWAAFNWAGEINLKKDSPENLAALPKVAAMMRRVKELDSDYYFAGPEIFFGTYYSRPPMLGGNPKKAKAYFDKAQAINQGKYLMGYVLEAKYYAVTVQDKSLFESLLKKVADLPAGQLPNARLSDAVAKEKAAHLLEKENDLF